MVLSYLIGDNPLFRIAIYIFVGVSAGYVAIVAWWQVLWPDVVVPVFSGSPTQKALLAVPILLSGLLLMKASPPLSRLGMPAMGLLVGVGAAVAVGGAVNGTLLPQLGATIGAFDTRRSNTLGIQMRRSSWQVITTLVISTLGRRRDDGSVRFRPIEIVAHHASSWLQRLGAICRRLFQAPLP
jgi:hypothetical protein